MTGKGEAKKKIDAYGLDAVCDDLADGVRYRDLAQTIGVSTRALCDWIAADPTRSVRARESQAQSADRWDDEAEDVLDTLPPDATLAQVARARELAQHYRWRAKCRNPGRYGDRQQVDLTAEVKIQSIDQVDAELRRLLDKSKAPRRGGNQGADEGDED